MAAAAIRQCVQPLSTAQPIAQHVLCCACAAVSLAKHVRVYIGMCCVRINRGVRTFNWHNSLTKRAIDTKIGKSHL